MPDDNLNAPEGAEPITPEGEAATPPEPQPQESAGHPAWEEAWKDVPEAIREQQRPFFEKMDRDYQELMARHAPYRDFEQYGVAPERLASAVQLQNALLNDPRGFWEQMASEWGFSVQEAQQFAQDKLDELDPDDPIAKRLAALEGQLSAREQQQMQLFQQQEQARRVEAETQKVDMGLAAIEQKHGKLDEEERTRIVEWALKNAVAGRNPDIQVAFYEYQKFKDSILQQQRPAPRVIGGGGGGGGGFSGGGQQQPPKPMNDDERLQAALNLAKNLATRQQ